LNVLFAFIPFVSLCANMIFQIMFTRNSRKGLLAAIVIGFVLGSIFDLVVNVALIYYSQITWYEFGGVLVSYTTYTALSYCYFHFVNLGETARRIRILQEIGETKKGMTLEDLLARYNAEYMLRIRIARLVNSRQIKLVDGKYKIDSKIMLMICSLMSHLRFLLLSPGT